MRIGQGFDSHRLEENRKLIIGGVEIPFEKGCVAHSDGDVLVHAIIDSIFGAINNHDIGYHFPDTDDKYKDINSLVLLKNTSQIMQNAGYKIINIDSTIKIEKPKMKPYIEDMKKNISNALNIDIDQISIKAKTNEGKDAVGNSELIEAHTIILLQNSQIG